MKNSLEAVIFLLFSLVLPSNSTFSSFFDPSLETLLGSQKSYMELIVQYNLTCGHCHLIQSLSLDFKSRLT